MPTPSVNVAVAKSAPAHRSDSGLSVGRRRLLASAAGEVVEAEAYQMGDPFCPLRVERVSAAKQALEAAHRGEWVSPDPIERELNLLPATVDEWLSLGPVTVDDLAAMTATGLPDWESDLW